MRGWLCANARLVGRAFRTHRAHSGKKPAHSRRAFRTKKRAFSAHSGQKSAHSGQTVRAFRTKCAHKKTQKVVLRGGYVRFIESTTRRFPSFTSSWFVCVHPLSASSPLGQCLSAATAVTTTTACCCARCWCHERRALVAV